MSIIEQLSYLKVVCGVSAEILKFSVGIWAVCGHTIENGLISKCTTKHLARLYLQRIKNSFRFNAQH